MLDVGARRPVVQVCRARRWRVKARRLRVFPHRAVLVKPNVVSPHKLMRVSALRHKTKGCESLLMVCVFLQRRSGSAQTRQSLPVP